MRARGLTYLSTPENGEEKKHAATAPKAKQDGQLFSPHKDTNKRLLISLELTITNVSM